MKNLILLFIFPIVLFSQNDAFAQTRMIMGGGVIYPSLENSLPEDYHYLMDNALKPFVGFSYEQNLNEQFTLLGNLNYSKNKILVDQIFNDSIFIDFFVWPNVQFVQISAGGLLNYKIFSGLHKSKLLNGFKIGLGLNIDTFRDFKGDRSSFFNQDFSNKENRYQIGLLSNISWEHKNFRISYQFLESLKMFGDHEKRLIQATNWRTLSASYIYTLNE